MVVVSAMDCGLIKSEKDWASLTPGGKHRLDAILRRSRRHADLEREVGQVGGDTIQPEQAALVGRAPRNGHDVIDPHLESRRQGVIEECHRAPGKRA